MSDLAQERETGVEKSTAECPECGKEVPVVESEYGSLAAGVCTKCYGKATKKDQVEAQKAAAEMAEA